MIFNETPLKGAYTIELEKRGDDRGFFARLFCEREFAAKGLVSNFVQINNSVSATLGTLRGMHFQVAPHAEVKLVRCIQGALFDVIVDLRPESSTYRQWYGAELSATNRRMMYVPTGFAHGFQTLTDEAEALYLVSSFYAPDAERGLRYNDPAIGIEWPSAPTVVSAKDEAWPLLEPDVKGVAE